MKYIDEIDPDNVDFKKLTAKVNEIILELNKQKNRNDYWKF